MRQDRTNLSQLGVGFVGGRFPPLRPLGSAALLGDIEDDSADDSDAPLDIIKFVNDDTAVWSGTGSLIIGLSFVPWSDSLQVKLNGHEIEPTDWTYDSSLNTVTIPAEDWWAPALAAGVTFRGTAYYAYYEADTETLTDPVPWSSSGPYLVVAEGDTTDYSSLSLDDSGWSVGPAPLGYPVSPPDPFWPIPPGTNTGSNVNLGFWIRRRFSIDDTITVDINGRVDGQHWMYLDGVLIHSYTGTVPGADPNPSVTGVVLTPGTHVVALHVNDDTNDGSPDYIYGDIQVVLS